ncbi:MAG: hypothetical protein HZC29_07955, partial [Thaumarchaeota archaeon]|nr:hypothetical protein [Nitrososphaerota archaeon]
KAAASDGVAAANIAAKIASEAFKTSQLTAAVSGAATCSAGGATGTGQCTVTDEKVKLEFTVPGAATTGTYTVKTLIGDFVDRTLEDRGLGAASEYNFTLSETGTDNHPFSAGNAAGLGGVSEAKLFRIDGSMYDGFKDVTFEDKDSGKSFKEEQKLWVKAKTKWQATPNDVQGKVDQLIYQLKFYDGGTGNYGLPQCSESTNASYSLCGTTDSARLETHKVKVMFGGSEWVVTKLEAPSTTAENQSVLKVGGKLSLAKESISQIVNVGDVLKAQSGYSVRLDDIKSGSTSDEQSAIVSILDSNGVVVKQKVIASGSTSSTTVGSSKIMIRVYKTAPGYTLVSKWADMAVIQDEMTFEDNNYPQVNGETQKNKDGKWKVRLGWKRKETLAQSSNSNYTDHLRTVVLYKETAPSYMDKGEGIDVIADPVGFKFTYTGLNLDPTSSNDYDDLSFTVHKLEDFSYQVSGNDTTFTLTGASGGLESWMQIKSNTEDAFSTTAGSGSELAVLFGHGVNNTQMMRNAYESGYNIGIGHGTVLLKSIGSSNWVYVGNFANSTSAMTALDINYKVAGVKTSINESGSIRIGTGVNSGVNMSEVDTFARVPSVQVAGKGSANFSVMNSSLAANQTVVFLVSEDAGVGISEQYPDMVAFAYNITKADMSEDMGQYSKEKALVGSPQVASGINAAYGSYESSTYAAKVGYVTERGSILDSLGDDSAVLKVAKRVARAQFLLAPSSTAAASSATQVWEGKKGDETTISGTNGVKVKVADITYTPGACSVGGSVAACTVDSSKVTALINGASTAQAVQPYGYKNFAPLVVLDKDLNTDTVVSVGGPMVNTKTKSLLDGASVTLDASNPVLVWEAAQGKSVVVAGYSAADTLQAAQDFISQLQ